MYRPQRMGMFLEPNWHNHDAPNWMYMKIVTPLEGWAEISPEQLTIGFYRIAFPSTNQLCEQLFYAIYMTEQIYGMVPRGTQLIVSEETDFLEPTRTSTLLRGQRILGIQPVILLGFYRVIIPTDDQECKELEELLDVYMMPESVNSPTGWWGPNEIT